MGEYLQILFDEAELVEIREVAERHRMPVADWVRQTLRAARRRLPRSAETTKLEVVRAAAKHRFPTADIDQMLAEIESGYGTAMAE